MAKVYESDVPDRLNENGEPEWDTVSHESGTPVAWTAFGQSFTGTYVGEEEITPENDEPFTLYLFRDADGELWSVNQSYKIKAGMDKVQPGDMVRITYVKDVPTKPGFSAMKDFTVQVRRAR